MSTPEQNDDSIASRLRYAIELSGMTGKGFAYTADLSYASLRDYLSGTQPGADAIRKICAVLRLSADWLLTGEGEMHRPMADDGDQPLEGLNTNQERAGYGTEFVFVNQYAAKPSAGNGSVIEDQPPVSVIAFRHDWLAKRSQSNTASLAAFEVKGDSMEPTLFNGDLVVFNLAEKAVTVEDIYLFRLGGNLYVKRLRLMPDGDVLMISDNPRYEPVPIGEKTAVARSFEVIGRFFWRGGDRL